MQAPPPTTPSVQPDAQERGFGGIFSKLMEEHAEALALLNEIFRSAGTEREALYWKLRVDLRNHEKSESLVLYAEIERHAGGHEIAAYHLRDATKLEVAIDALDALSVYDSGWGEAFSRLASLVRDHIEREESLVFPAALSLLGKFVTRQLRSRYLDAKLLVTKTDELGPERAKSGAEK